MGDEQGRVYLMDQPSFFRFFDELEVEDNHLRMHRRVLANFYEEQMQLQRDLTMAEHGFALSEGLTFDSFKFLLHKSMILLGLHHYHGLESLVEEYEDYAWSVISAWKARELTA